MDIDALTDSQVKKLIRELKNFISAVTFNIPQLGKYKKEESVSGKFSNIAYKMHVYRGNIGYKYSIHLRFTNNNVHLIRLCINGSWHHNEDGTIVGKNHLHIYKYHDDHVENYAYDLKKLPFDNSDKLDAAVEKFINYTNIKGKEA